MPASLHASDDLDSADSYRFALKGSGLPVGMRFTQDGRLVGTPTETGTHRLTLRVTDDANVYDQRRYKLTVVSPRDGLPPATVGVGKAHIRPALDD